MLVPAATPSFCTNPCLPGSDPAQPLASLGKSQQRCLPPEMNSQWPRQQAQFLLSLFDVQVHSLRQTPSSRHCLGSPLFLEGRWLLRAVPAASGAQFILSEGRQLTWSPELLPGRHPECLVQQASNEHAHLRTHLLPAGLGSAGAPTQPCCGLQVHTEAQKGRLCTLQPPRKCLSIPRRPSTTQLRHNRNPQTSA